MKNRIINIFLVLVLLCGIGVLSYPFISNVLQDRKQDQILTEYPEIEIVQIQFNYLDYNDLSVQSKLVYEVCEKHNKPILIFGGANVYSSPNMFAEMAMTFPKVNLIMAR